MTEKVCPDMAVEYQSITKGAEYVRKTGSPAFVNYGLHTEEGEIIEPVYLITEQAYQYLLAKCSEDELWDLGFLGNSEEHTVAVPMNPRLQTLLGKN